MTGGALMANAIILDVSRYARLWRGIWWAQHLSTLLARMNRLLVVFPRSAHAKRAARWENLKPALANTPWSAAAAELDITGAPTIFLRSKGFVAIRSRAAHESDYEAALRVATFLMGREPEQGTSG